MAASQVVGYQNDFAHATILTANTAHYKLKRILLICRLWLNRPMSQDARVDEEQATQRRARILGLPYINTVESPPNELHKDLLTVQELYDMRVVPLSRDSGAITFGVTNTTPQPVMTGLRNRFLDQQVNFALISDGGYRQLMKLYDPPKVVEYQNISLGQAGQNDHISKVSDMLSQVRADDMLAYLVQQAHQLNASDIHLEPQRDRARIRFRIDGVLHRVAELDSTKYRILISAVASAGNVSTSSDDAQQGHIAQAVTMADGSKVDVNVRLETVPGVNGMEVVMRLFNMDQSMYNLDRLGLSDEERKVVNAIIARPTGLVLVVGPTGSGKTTTLYSMLNSLNNEERKIITIEDPVEYQISGITQLSIKSKSQTEQNFADRLRAVLRLDPDVVMVGEIRDMDTAKTALQAALTGHLVLATFHAGSASAAMTRLVDIIGQNPLFASAIRLVMAQRLVRRLDENAKEAYSPDTASLNQLKTIIDSFPPGAEKPKLENLTLYKPKPTPENPYGYKGQLAVREQFIMSEELAGLLTSGKATSAQQIEAAAVQNGMKTMLQDGVLKVLKGETSIEEISRVLG